MIAYDTLLVASCIEKTPTVLRLVLTEVWQKSGKISMQLGIWIVLLLQNRIAIFRVHCFPLGLCSQVQPKNHWIKRLLSFALLHIKQTKKNKKHQKTLKALWWTLIPQTRVLLKVCQVQEVVPSNLWTRHVGSKVLVALFVKDGIWMCGTINAQNSLAVSWVMRGLRWVGAKGQHSRPQMVKVWLTWYTFQHQQLTSTWAVKRYNNHRVPSLGRWEIRGPLRVLLRLTIGEQLAHDEEYRWKLRNTFGLFQLEHAMHWATFYLEKKHSLNMTSSMDKLIWSQNVNLKRFHQMTSVQLNVIPFPIFTNPCWASACFLSSTCMRFR